ncbi:purine nucleoside phosphorylase-like, partial [Engraulis encrasicolus]|uniref:purine nucleoside phosphorylase-like n=1 Tax=Engraulis encrasicolus TaxID=184585 RepID=UPI002FD5D49D
MFPESKASPGYTYDECRATADWLLDQLQVRPKVGIVCGSGLGRLAHGLKDQLVFQYGDIPNFPKSTGGYWSHPPLTSPRAKVRH